MTRGSGDEGALQGRRILVVDGDPDQLVFLAGVLEDNGATTRRASDGPRALELARSERLDLITLELVMPGMSGFEIFSALRNDAATRGIPVCIITGRPELRDKLVPVPKGFLTKPVTEKQMLLSIRRILEVPQRKAPG